MSENVDEVEVERQSIVSRKIRLGYVISNGISSIAELSAGLITGNMAQTADGLHGVSEISIGNSQMKDAHNQDHVHDKRRKRIYSALFGATLTAAVVAGSEIITGSEAGIDSPVLETLGFGASGLAFTSGLAAAIAIRRRVENKYGSFVSKETREAATSTEHDVVKHIFLLDLPSSGMAFTSGAVRMAGNYIGMKHGVQNTLEYIDNGIGVTSALWGAYLFRPTAANLEHHHDHSHETLTPAAESLVDVRDGIV